MSQNEFPDLGQIAATMSRNHVRLMEAAKTLSSRVDELVAAAASQDWSAVEQMSREFAESSRAKGYRVLSGMAERLAEEARRPQNEVGIKRNLIRLIGTHSRVASSATC